MEGSRILQNVMATLLGAGAVLAVSAAVAGISYCGNNYCVVYPPVGGGGSTTVPPECPENTIPTDGGCMAVATPAVCSDLISTIPAQCDVRSPPPLEVNGCGSTGSSAVPDYLVAPPPWTAEAITFGNIFTAACNVHDQCYGTYLADKNSCDNLLTQDMIAGAQAGIPPSRHYIFMPIATGQAVAYGSALQWYFVENNFSNAAYQSAQIGGECRVYRQLLIEYNCGAWIDL